MSRIGMTMMNNLNTGACMGTGIFIAGVAFLEVKGYNECIIGKYAIWQETV